MCDDRAAGAGSRERRPRPSGLTDIAGPILKRAEQLAATANRPWPAGAERSACRPRRHQSRRPGPTRVSASSRGRTAGTGRCRRKSRSSQPCGAVGQGAPHKKMRDRASDGSTVHNSPFGTLTWLAPFPRTASPRPRPFRLHPDCALTGVDEGIRRQERRLAQPRPDSLAASRSNGGSVWQVSGGTPTPFVVSARFVVIPPREP